MLNALWIGFKFLLSLVFVAASCFIFFAYIHEPSESSSPIVIASIFLVLAAAPWLASVEAMRKNGIAAGLLGILFGFGFGAMANEEFHGLVKHPVVCSGKGFLICSLTNWLYEAGGAISVGSFYALISALILFASLAFIKRAKNT